MKLKSVSWYLGLTKDFREWEAFGTILNPRTHKAFENYIWFYGPFKDKSEAVKFKKDNVF